MVEAKPRAAIRCAIYTRKSTEDGLEQEFNSLDAQREACAAYILSQRHEGWTLVPGHYDDGGFSGGTMERPGLKRLLAEVEAGRVDVIVVYKVDRLTRSLADFAKIVEILDAKGASFVSITQAFTTTTSMGRLTLNVLLSFAQFEREVTGERIRDKIAASKRKGLWMGGPVPLGYEVQDRKLIVVESEAALVRHIMRRYLALGSVRELVDELASEKRVTKIQNRVSGPHKGGVPFRRGTLYHLLQNRIYLGEIVHKGVAHPGEHEPIVPPDLWERVELKLADRACGPSLRTPAQHPSLLIGRVIDGLGRPMTPVHANKARRRYRYYVTRPDLVVGTDAVAWRVSAHDLEAIVIRRAAGLLDDRLRIHALVAAHLSDANAINRTLRAANLTANTLRDGLSAERAALLPNLVDRVALHEHHLEVAIKPATLLEILGVATEPVEDEPAILLECETARVRRGHELRLVLANDEPSSDQAAPRDDKLVTLLAEARAARELVLASPNRSIATIAADTGRCRKRLARLVGLSCLAPSIVTAIIEGRQDASLTARILLATDLPLAWNEQAALLGVA